MFFLHWWRNFLKEMKKVLVELINGLFYNIIHRLVGWFDKWWIYSLFSTVIFLKKICISYSCIFLCFFWCSYSVNKFSVLTNLMGGGWWYIVTSYHWPHFLMRHVFQRWSLYYLDMVHQSIFYFERLFFSFSWDTLIYLADFSLFWPLNVWSF